MIKAHQSRANQEKEERNRKIQQLQKWDHYRAAQEKARQIR